MFITFNKKMDTLRIVLELIASHQFLLMKIKVRIKVQEMWNNVKYLIKFKWIMNEFKLDNNLPLRKKLKM